MNFCEFLVLFLVMGIRAKIALVQSAGHTLLLGVGMYLAGVKLLSTAAASMAFMMMWGICIAFVLDMQVHRAYDMLSSLYICKRVVFNVTSGRLHAVRPAVCGIGRPQDRAFGM